MNYCSIVVVSCICFFFFSSRRRHTRFDCDWSSDVCSSDLKMIADAGFRWVRMDFVWADTEHERGRYDFSAYDRLMQSLDQFKLHALFIQIGRASCRERV